MSIFGSLRSLIIYTCCIILCSCGITYAAFVPPPYSKNFSIQPDKNYSEQSSLLSDDSRVILHGSRDNKKIALTFDAEMTDFMKVQLLTGQVKLSYDPRIIEILNKTQTKATIFLTGMWMQLYPDVTRALANNSLFELGSHSFTDSSFHGDCFGLKKLSRALAFEDVGATEKLLREYAGIDNILFRFPGGCYGSDDIELVSQAGDIVIHWDVAGNDGFNGNTPQIVQNVVSSVQNGSIIVLHLNGPPTAPKTADALPEIISILRQKGFEFVKIHELLGVPEEQKNL